MLGMILPADVESEVYFGETSGGLLFPEEEKIIAHTVEARRREYAAVRSCARACLERLGYPAGSDPARCGRCTHLAGRDTGQHDPLHRLGRSRGRYRPTDLTIGIDAEPDAPLPDGVLGLIATAAEHDHLAAVHGPDDPNWDRLLFSAKEAVYKAWFPLVGEWLDHHDVEISFDPQHRTFTALLSRDDLILNGRHIHQLHGRWIRERGIVLTAVVLRAQREDTEPERLS